jgi:hypothetical protein
MKCQLALLGCSEPIRARRRKLLLDLGMTDKKSFADGRDGWTSHAPKLTVEPAAPACTRCRSRLLLKRIEPSEPGFDLRTYECARCGEVDHYKVRYQTSDPWMLIKRAGL